MTSYDHYLADINQWREEQRKLEAEEELLTPIDRKGLYPILRPDIWKFFEKHDAAHWVATEVDLTKDREHWENKLNEDEKKYIKNVIAFFAGSDFIVNDNGKEDASVPNLEFQYFNNSKTAREDVHSIQYANLLEEYVSSDEEKEHLKDAVRTIESIKAKSVWMYDYIQNGTFVERDVACSIMEGIFFSSSFCAIFWLKKRNLMPGLCDSNEFISRDEGIHRDFSIHIYNTLRHKMDSRIVIDMIKRAVQIEQAFVKDSLPVRLIGMNDDQMCEYVEFVADTLSQGLIQQKIYNTKNPFEWMTAQSLELRTDFFAHRVNAYANSSIGADKEKNMVRFDDEF